MRRVMGAGLMLVDTEINDYLLLLLLLLLNKLKNSLNLDGSQCKEHLPFKSS
jgi:hypothetical protein